MTTRLEPVDQPALLASVMLYWLPLGAGGHSVRWNGRIFEALVARHERRAATCTTPHSRYTSAPTATSLR